MTTDQAMPITRLADHAIGHVIVVTTVTAIAAEAPTGMIIITTGTRAHGAHVLTRTQTLLAHAGEQ